MLQRIFLLLCLWPIFLHGQSIKGILLDAQSEMPLVGATVQLLTITPTQGTTTDLDGYFSFNQLPPGRHELQISYLGYLSKTIPNILLTTGKDVILELTLEESITDLAAVEVRASTDPALSANEMATVSSRSFTAEQVNRFAGGRADISRMAGNMAGVATANDSRNDIVIRGNSPSGLLWQLEGIPIPNPNHFSTLGTTGGPVSAFNPNLLASSDFFTSAFPAEFGNATSGVFDLRFRTGNRDQAEYMLQLGSFSGLEAMAEGPIGKQGASYVAAFRNSFVGFAEAIGIPIGTNATPDYRDLAFKIDLPTKKAGKFALFGIGGTSNIDFLGSEIDANDLFAEADRNSYPRSRFGVLGLRHNLVTGENTYLRTTLSGSLQVGLFEAYTLDEQGEDDQLFTQVDDQTTRYSIKSFINSKLSNRLTVRAGIQGDLSDLKTVVDDRDGRPDRNEDGIADLDRVRDFDGTFGLYQVFAQARYKLGNRTTINPGIHTQYFGFTADFSLEPRLGLTHQLSSRWALHAGYGRHTQTAALPVFFFRDMATGNPDANQSLGFLQSDHYVLGADYSFATNWRIKTEVYYQRLFDIPVDVFPSSFSLLNAGADFVFPQRANLVNEGSGQNYGIELTLERFFTNNWYLLFTNSVFESNYKGSDGIQRNTAFNNQYVSNFLLGKEWAFGKLQQHRFTLNTKVTAAGGQFYTPVDVAASRASNTEIRDDSRAFSLQYDHFFRFDLKIGIQLNKPGKKFSQSFFLDLQNLTNRKNIFQERYNPATQMLNTVYQSAFFPDIQYRVQF